jgi:hypothetical protein
MQLSVKKQGNFSELFDERKTEDQHTGLIQKTKQWLLIQELIDA